MRREGRFLLMLTLVMLIYTTGAFGATQPVELSALQWLVPYAPILQQIAAEAVQSTNHPDGETPTSQPPTPTNTTSPGITPEPPPTPVAPEPTATDTPLPTDPPQAGDILLSIPLPYPTYTLYPTYTPAPLPLCMPA